MAFTDPIRAREYKREWKRQWKLANREKYLAQHRAEERARYNRIKPHALAYSKVYKKKNVARVREWNRISSKRHPETSLKHAEMRRARILGATLEDCKDAIASLRKIKLCTYCVQPIIGTTHIDHLVPLTRGGAHAPSNLVACCKSCNSSKGNRLLSEWRKFRLKEAA